MVLKEKKLKPIFHVTVVTMEWPEKCGIRHYAPGESSYPSKEDDRRERTKCMQAISNLRGNPDE
jgi:hypothetical protein